MAELLRTVITEVGPEVEELVAGGVLILFAAGAPPELAEVSVLHAIKGSAAAEAPRTGAELRIGTLSTTLTGIGQHAWDKVRDMGHVVVNFNGRETPERDGELSAAAVNLDALTAALKPGAEIVISA